MLAADQVIRALKGPDDRTRSFSLNGEAIRALMDGAKAHLTNTLTEVGLLEALDDTRRVASLIAHRQTGIPPDVATFDALFLLANEDALQSLPPTIQEPVDSLRTNFDSDTLNELSALCQLEDFPGFFHSADDAALQMYLFKYVLDDSRDQNILIRECLVDLDEA
jgi:hypothetical protein